MANIALANVVPYANNHSFSQVWALSRVLKKAGYKYKGSGDGVSSKDTTGNPANDKWGAGGLTGNSGSAASIGAKVFDDLTVTGLTGMTANSVGNFLTFTNAGSSPNNTTVQIVFFINSGSVKVRNASGVASDANNGTINWTERDPTLDTYSPTMDTATAWILYEGTSTQKIPMGTPSAAFVRGEKVTQASTNAEGEIIGSVISPSGNFLVVLPRMGSFSNNTGYTLTGAVSNTTVNPSGGAILTYVSELVLAKSTDVYSGWIFNQRCEATTESAQRFSTLMSSAGCTATTPPGGGGTGNTFPTIAYVVRGGSPTSATAWLNYVFGGSYYMNQGFGHMACANTIPNPGVSPDGSFWIACSMPGEGAINCNGWAYFRCDDTEVGDLDPYVWYSTVSSPTRTTASTLSTYSWTAVNSGNTVFASGGFVGWRRRGYGTADTWVQLYSASLRYFGGSSVQMNPTNDPDRISAHPDQPYTRENIYIAGADTGLRCRKGTVRWLAMVPPVSTLYTRWEGGLYLQVGMPTTGGYASLVLGPWDNTPAKYA